MKKLGKFLLLLLFSSLFLVACSNKVTVQDLKANKWLIGPEEESSMIASFTDDVMTLNFDTQDTEVFGEADSEVDESEEIGQDFAKSLAEKLEFNLNYVLEEDTITIQNLGNKNGETAYNISKEESNIIFTPVEESSDTETLVLVPYKDN